MRYKLPAALAWRFRYLNEMKQKALWYCKRVFDFRKKEKVSSFTIIVVGRNDNYGGDFSKRLEVTLDWNLKNIPNAELIYIEWNQIPDRPSDCEWVASRYSNARCYIVPNEIHKNIAAQPEKMPVMEYFAKNIGIRRTKNDWVLMVNADVCIGLDVVSRLKYLNKNTIYGTHYINLKWDKNTINKQYLENKKNWLSSFPSPLNMCSVVGNLIITHRQNWINATGYDENLNNVRIGVDRNGLNQLLYMGLKKRVLGSHFHLDHPESIIHGSNETHGEHNFGNIPYQNNSSWGFFGIKEKVIGERIWQFEKI